MSVDDAQLRVFNRAHDTQQSADGGAGRLLPTGDPGCYRAWPPAISLAVAFTNDQRVASGDTPTRFQPSRVSADAAASARLTGKEPL